MAEIIKIEGLSQLYEDLKKFPEELQNKAIAKAARAGAKIVLKAARQKAPVRAREWEGMKYANPPGTLKKGIKVEKYKRVPKWFARDIIGFSPEAWYGALVEIGHKIVRGGTLAGGEKRRKTPGLPFTRGKNPRPTTSGQGKIIGYAAARPFLRPAFDDNRDKIFQAMKETLADHIDKIKMGIIKVKK